MEKPVAARTSSGVANAPRPRRRPRRASPRPRDASPRRYRAPGPRRPRTRATSRSALGGSARPEPRPRPWPSILEALDLHVEAQIPRAVDDLFSHAARDYSGLGRGEVRSVTHARTFGARGGPAGKQYRRTLREIPPKCDRRHTSVRAGALSWSAVRFGLAEPSSPWDERTGDPLPPSGGWGESAGVPAVALPMQREPDS